MQLMRKTRASSPPVTITPIGEIPKYLEAAEAVAAIRARQAETAARRARAMAMIRRENARTTLSSKISAAAELVAGGFIPSTDPVAELAACDREDEILRDAQADAERTLTEISDGLSDEVCRQVRPAHESALLAAMTAIEALSAAVSDLQAIKAGVVGAGYKPMSYILPAPLPGAVFALGNPENQNTQAASFRRWLQMEGIAQ